MNAFSRKVMAGLFLFMAVSIFRSYRALSYFYFSKSWFAGGFTFSVYIFFFVTQNRAIWHFPFFALGEFFFSFKWVCCLLGEFTFGHSGIVLICLSKMLYILLICFRTQSRCPTVLCNTGIPN